MEVGWLTLPFCLPLSGPLSNFLWCPVTKINKRGTFLDFLHAFLSAIDYSQFLNRYLCGTCQGVAARINAIGNEARDLDARYNR